MLYTKEDVIDYIRMHLKIISVIKLEVLLKIVLNYYYPSLTENSALMIMREMQNKRYLLLSEDGYVMTTGAYVKMTGDIFYNQLLHNYTYRVKAGLDYTKSRDGINPIDCLAVYAELIPYSENLVIGKGVWDVVFNTVEHDGELAKLYCVKKFPDGYESVYADSLKMAEYNYDPVDKVQIRRVALFDNPERSYLTPRGYGFTTIACVNYESEMLFDILEVNEWSDAWDK